MRAKHVVVGHQGLLVAEQVGKVHRPLYANEAVIAGDFPARRQRAALLGDTFDMTAQFNFFGKQGIAGAAVFSAFVGIAKAVAASQLVGGNKVGSMGHGRNLRWRHNPLIGRGPVPRKGILDGSP